MNFNDIKNRIKNTEPKPIDDDVRFSVLVPMIKIDGEIHLIYEVRSKSIRQPGEISFPGGRIEENESPVYAAVRETREELNINEADIEIIAELDYATNKLGSFIYTFAGIVKNTCAAEINYNRDEVSELFFVPLDYFMENEPEKYYMNYLPKADDDFPYHMVNDGENYNWGQIRYPVYFYKYGDYIIWGLTAKITYNFINKIKNCGTKEL